jgi:hypothetical protein
VAARYTAPVAPTTLEYRPAFNLPSTLATDITSLAFLVLDCLALDLVLNSNLLEFTSDFFVISGLVILASLECSDLPDTGIVD